MGSLECQDTSLVVSELQNMMRNIGGGNFIQEAESVQLDITEEVGSFPQEFFAR